MRGLENGWVSWIDGHKVGARVYLGFTRWGILRKTMHKASPNLIVVTPTILVNNEVAD